MPGRTTTAPRPSVFAAMITALTALFVGAPAHAQCTPAWLANEGVPGVTGDLPVEAATAWDPDGAGPAPEVLVIGGGFYAAGKVVSPSIAVWDGERWSSPGGGMNGRVWALTVYNGDLIAGGDFTIAGGVQARQIARWDGSAWHAMGSGVSGTGSSVTELTVYNGELIAGGWFTHMNGVQVNGIARWDGSTWRSLGTGVGPSSNGITVVNAVTVHNGDLVVAGGFSTAGGVEADNVARWNGSSWAGYNDPYDVINVNTLISYNGELLAAGSFINSSSRYDFVVRWTGSAWQPFGTGTNDHVNVLRVYNGDLVAGGLFTNAGGVSAFHLARWDGTAWHSLGFGMVRVNAFAEFGGELILGGSGSRPSGVRMSQVLRWDGTTVRTLGSGGFDVLFDIETYNGELIAAAYGIARRVGNTWAPLGDGGILSGGNGYIIDLAVYGDSLILAGSFTAIDGVPANGTARWDGISWHPFGDVPVSAMMVHGAHLYAAGNFGGNSRVARWDPKSESWDPLGEFPPNVGISAMTVFNGEIIAGGIGGIGAPASIFRWDGQTWHGLGQQFGPSLINAMVVYNGELLAGGGAAPGALSRFNGTSWEPFHGGLYLDSGSTLGEVLIVFDLLIHDGELIVAGSFSHAGSDPYTGGVLSPNVVRWNGTQWLAMGAATNDAVICVQPYGSNLAMGGWFDLAGTKPSAGFARWGIGGIADYNSDGFIDGIDYDAFNNDFESADPQQQANADVNGDGFVDGIDYDTFNNAFESGC